MVDILTAVAVVSPTANELMNNAIESRVMNTHKMNQQGACPSESSATPRVELRVYTKKELAQIFFPHYEPRTAQRNLYSMICRDEVFRRRMEAAGYVPKKKHVPPKAVRLLFDEFGLPGDTAPLW